jgi:hypothetical protein
VLKAWERAAGLHKTEAGRCGARLRRVHRF